MLDIELNGIEKMKNELLDEWNKKIEYYSNNLTNTFIKNEWEKFCSDKKYLYFSLLKGHSRIERKFYSLFLPRKLKYSKSNQLVVKNIISCETHREILLTILNSEK
jgi:poly-gamma-glutamate synthesis protein (capsule biosynthesis protein)